MRRLCVSLTLIVAAFSLFECSSDDASNTPSGGGNAGTGGKGTAGSSAAGAGGKTTASGGSNATAGVGGESGSGVAGDNGEGGDSGEAGQPSGGSSGAGTGGGGTAGTSGGAGGTSGASAGTSGGGAGGTSGGGTGGGAGTAGMGGGGAGGTSGGGAGGTAGTSGGGAGGTAGTAGTGGGGAGGTAGSGGAPAVGTFAAVRELFDSRCASCHNGTDGSSTVLTRVKLSDNFTGATPLSNADLYTTLTNPLASVPSCVTPTHTLIVPNDVTDSFILTKLSSAPTCGSQMPAGCADNTKPTFPCLTSDQLNIVTAWINAGAPD